MLNDPLGHRGTLPHEWRALPPASRWAVVAIAAWAVIVRLIHLNQSMRYDEAAMFLRYASGPISGVLSDYSYPNNHVLHTLLVWCSTRLFGSDPWAIRLPTLVAGLLLLPTTYAAARRLGEPGAALASSAIVAALPALVLYSTNARGYIVVCVAFTLLLITAADLFDQGTPRRWLNFAVITTLGMYVVPVMMYPAIVVSTWIVFESWRRGRAQGVMKIALPLTISATAAAAGTLLLYSPIIARSGVGVLVSNRFVTALSWPEFLAALPLFVRSLRESLGLGLSAGILVVLGATCGAAAIAPERGRGARCSLAISAVAGCALLLVASRRPPPARAWLFLLPLASIYAGIGFEVAARAITAHLHRSPDAFAAVLTALLCALISGPALRNRAVFNSPETGVLRDGSEIARDLLRNLGSQDRLIVAAQAGPPLDFYLRSQGAPGLTEFTSQTRTGGVFVVVDAVHGQTIDNLVARRPDVGWERLTRPALFKRYDGSAIYTAQRRRTSSDSSTP